MLNGQVKEDVDTTYDLIQQGLDKLNQQINGEQTAEEADNDSRETVEALNDSIGQASMQSSYSRSASTQVEIMTREGDRILVALFKNQSAGLQSSADGNNISSSRSISASAGISYQVEGELSKDEQKAIDELLSNVAQVSERFFSGEVQSAFNYAREMDFNAQELTRFSLNMNYQETRQVAINTYSNYQPQVSDDASQSAGSPALEFIRQLDKLLQTPFAQHNFAEPAQSINALVKAVDEQLYSDTMQQLQQDSTSMLTTLVEQIKQFRGAQSIPADQENSAVSG